MQSSAPGHSLEADTRFLTETFRHALLPAMLSMGGIMASTLTTSFLAGNLLGDETLAILSIVNPVYFLFATIGSLAGVGAASLAAWCIGKDDQEGLQAAVTLAALLSLGLSAVLILLGVLFCGPLAALLGASGELLEPTRQYLLVYLFSGLGIAGVYTPFFLLKLQGRHKLSMALFVGLAIGCVALELFSVRVLHLGLNGIALGWTVANLIVTALGWFCLLGRKTGYRLCTLSKLKPYALRLMTAGSPAALNNLCSVLRTMALNLAIVPLAGQLGLSAFSVVSMANNLALIIINGLPQTTNPFVGVFSSERDTVSLRQLMVQALRSGLLLIAAFSLLLALLAKPFCAMFGVTAQETLAVALPAIRLFALSLPLNLLSNLMMNYYLSSGRTWLANLLTGTRAYLMVVLSLRLLQPLGIVGVWLSFTTAELLGWIVTAVALALYRRRKPALQGVLLLDRRYEQDSRNISFSVHTTQDDILNASQLISTFCEENQLDPQNSMLISLSLEEMLLSIREHSFPEDPSQTIDVRILIVPAQEADGKGSIILRIRCSGAPFNPISYYQQRQQDADQTDDDLDSLLNGLDDSLGIAMIVSSASQVDYKTTFGVNNLTILI